MLQMKLASALRMSFSSFHRFLITLSCIIGLFYSVTWLKFIGLGVIDGQSDSVLNFGLLGLGLYALFQQRDVLKPQVAEEADKLLGHGLVVSGIAVFPLIRSSISLQSVVFAGILFGLALSHWGLGFFKRYWSPTLMLLVAIYPNLDFIAIRIFRLLTPHMALERLMAWLGEFGLKAIGQKAIAQAQYLSLPEGSVEVGSGCTGFSMAFTLLGCSLLIGVFFRLSYQKTLTLMLIGVAIAMVFNVPRIMLLANAAVYWGDASFHFWHDSWGSQIFASIMFTAYYYAVMPFLDMDASEA